MVDTKVRVVNKYGQDVAMDGQEIGEIIVYGKGVADEDLKQEAHNGWVYTGDFGTIDQEGRIHVVKSNQDISTVTNNLSTFEIERILNEHPHIQEVSVIPQPHHELGEIAHAFLVSNTTINEDELLHYIQEKDSTIKTNIKFTFLEELPKTTSGKILKKQLEEQ